MRSTDLVRLVVIAGAVLFSLLLLIRVLPVMRFLLFFVLLAALIGIGIYLFRNYWREKEQEKAYGRTIAGQITGKIRDCEQQLERLDEEATRIEQSLNDLRKKLAQNNSVSEGVRAQTEHLIQGFEQELKLRETKKNFYVKCLQKLRSLLAQHGLLSELEKKKAELDGYREQHYDDIARMEALRWDVDREAVSLDTIQDLSTRMRDSEQMDDVLHLQKELEKMLRE